LLNLFPIIIEKKAEALLMLGSDTSNLETKTLESHWKGVLRGGVYDPTSGVIMLL